MILSIFVFNFVKRCSKSGGIVIGRRAAEAVSRGSSILQIFFLPLFFPNPFCEKTRCASSGFS